VRKNWGCFLKFIRVTIPFFKHWIKQVSQNIYYANEHPGLYKRQFCHAGNPRLVGPVLFSMNIDLLLCKRVWKKWCSDN